MTHKEGPFQKKSPPVSHSSIRMAPYYVDPSIDTLQQRLQFPSEQALHERFT